MDSKNINKQKMMEALDKIQIPFHKLDGEIENREYRFMFDGEDIVDIENPVDIGKFMDWLKEIIQNSKYTAPIQTFLYNNFSKEKFIEIFNGTVQLIWDKSTKKIIHAVYQFVNHPIETTGDIVIEVNSAYEFLKKYYENQTELMKSILTVILVLLGSGITGMVITSAFKKIRAKKIENGRLALSTSNFEGGQLLDINNGIIIDGNGNDNNDDDNNDDDMRDPSFQGWIDTTNRNIRNIIQQHNVLEERVSNIRECNCNDNNNNNNQRFFGQISQQQHLDIQQLIQKQNHLIIDNSVGSFVDAMFQPEIYQEAATQVNTTIKRRRKKKEKVNVIDTSHDRSFQRDENYVFDILTDHWVLHNNSNFQSGWRTNLNAQNMPRNFIIDTFHGEWVAVGAEMVFKNQIQTGERILVQH